MNISPKAREKLKEGKTIKLQNRKFSSWSESMDEAYSYLKSGIVIKYSPKIEDIVINIGLFEKLLFQEYDHGYFPEIILKNSQETLIIYPDQIVFSGINKSYSRN